MTLPLVTETAGGTVGAGEFTRPEAHAAMMSPQQIDRLRTNFKVLTPQGEELFRRFFTRLFNAQPGLRQNLPRDFAQQHRDHLSTLGSVVKNLHRLDAVEHILMDLGARAQRAGVQPQHFGVAREHLVATIRELSGPTWNEDLQADWTEALNVVASVMIRGAGRARAYAA